MVPTALHLLLVEDNAGDAHLLRELLRHTKGLEITHVDRLADGLRVLGEGHVDIVLLDLGLPDSDGLDTLRTVVASFPEVPVIVSTGHDEEAIANAALEIGAEEYLPKGTLDSTVFLRSIRYSIGRHEQRRKIQQLNGILHSLRNINQNIVREKDPDRLIEKACEELTAMRGTEIAWIGLGDTESPPTAFVEAGWGKTFEPIARDLDQGKWPPCRRWAQESPDGIVLLDPETRCNTCPLQHKYSHGQDRALVVALRHDKEDLGVLNVSFPVGVSIDDEEKSLFVEMAGDIALALHHISLEKERRRYAQIVATSSEAMALVDRQYRYLVTNPSYCELVGHAGKDLTGRHVAEILGDTSFREEVEPEMLRCWSGKDAHYETLRGTSPQRIVDILYTPYRSADGAISAAAVCIRDITAQRLAEKVQRSESLRAQQYLDIVSVIIVAIDADGVVTMINPKGCDVLGYPEDEIVGKNWFSNFIAPAIRNEIRHVASSILAATNDSLAEYENPVVTRSGEERLIAWTNSPILDSEGKIVGHLGAGEDVTHRRKLDRDRRESQKETESLLRATRAILVESEFAKASSAVLEICSEHIGVDPGYTALLGLAKELPPALILKQGGSDCALDPGVTMPLRGLWEKAFKACKPVYENAFTSSEHRKRLPEGHLVLENVLVAPLVIDGESTGLIALANKPGGFGKQDARMARAFAEILAIAIREDRIRKARVASETQYRTLFARSADAMTTLAPPSWHFQSGNPAALKLLRISDEREFLAHGPWDYSPEIQPDGRSTEEAAREMIDVAMETGSHFFDWQHQRSDGQIFPATVLLSRIEISGQVLLQATIRDMTEQQNLQSQIAQADRLSTMGMLAAGVAHEINNPLSYILYNLESVTKDLPSVINAVRDLQSERGSGGERSSGSKPMDDFARVVNPVILTDIAEQIGDALEGTHRIRDIARGLGTFSRVEKNQRVPVNLGSVIDVATNMASNEIKYRARLTKNYGKIPTVLANEGRLSQVFLNLIINATHAIEEGNVDNHEIRVKTWGDDDSVFAEVRDTGCGIREENLGRLFEPFFTTKKVGEGSGLGLAISKNIIESYGGSITVESELGKGTAFTLQLPIRKQEVVAAEKSPVRDDEGGMSGRILVVDDEDAIRIAIARILNKHEVVQAASGSEAKEILQGDQAFDLILCDVMMPEISGMAFHKWLGETYPKLARQFIFMTGGAFTPKAADYLSRVDNIRLEKPFDVVNLRKIVDNMLLAAR